jgi:hypothetical protein
MSEIGRRAQSVRLKIVGKWHRDGDSAGRYHKQGVMEQGQWNKVAAGGHAVRHSPSAIVVAPSAFVHCHAHASMADSRGGSACRPAGQSRRRRKKDDC